MKPNFIASVDDTEGTGRLLSVEPICKKRKTDSGFGPPFSH
jgi:hypothetical protein